MGIKRGRGLSKPQDKPCPTCYLPMRQLDSGEYECTKHGIPAKEKSIKINTQVPLTDKSEKKEYDNRWNAQRVRDKWKKMGLEVISEELRRVVCLTCRKETPFFCADTFRHEEGCPMRVPSLALVGKTEEDTKWSRRGNRDKR